MFDDDFDFDDDLPIFDLGDEVIAPDNVKDETPDIEGIHDSEPDDVPAVDSDGISEMSDAEINAIFGDIMAADRKRAEEDAAVIAASEAVVEAEAIAAETAAKLEKATAEAAKYADEISELERKLTEAKRRKAEWEKGASFTMLRIEANRTKRVADSAKREKDMALQAFADKEEAKQLAHEYLDRAKNFDWFKGVLNPMTGETYRIKKHQWQAVQFMVSAERCILGDGMGLGKTLSAIASADIAGAKKVLIVAPTDITTNFLAEFNFWSPKPVINFKGMTKAERDGTLLTLSFLDEYVVLVNYEAWRKDLSLLVKFSNVGFDTVIMDEAHVAKDISSVTYRGLKQIITSNNLCPKCGTIAKAEIAHAHICSSCGWGGEANVENDGRPWAERYWDTKSVKRVWPMTGTPILNRPQDLFALLSLIDPVNFDKMKTFLDYYCWLDPYTGKWRFQSGGVDLLMRRLSGKFLARNMHDAGIVLPPQHPIVHEIVLDPVKYRKQIEVYNQITKHAMIKLSEEKAMNITAIIAIITRQRQAMVWPGGIELKDDEGVVIWRVAEDVQESAKIDAAIDMIKEFTANGERVVVFSQFSTALRELHARVNNSENDEGDLISSVVFDGTTPDSVRAEIKTNFDKKRGEHKKWDVVLANYKTGGVGLNLTAATRTIILDKEWNPGKEDQALARTHRIGQDAETFVHVLTVPGTIESWMDELNNQKREMVGGFNEGANDLKEQFLSKLKEL